MARPETPIEKVVAAARAVAESNDTDDGMVEVKWDEMVHLRDALWLLDQQNR